MLEIISSPYEQLDASRQQQLRQAADTAFGEYEIVRQTTWSRSDWSFLCLENSKLASFYNLVLRTVQFDGVPVEVAGLNNMITLPGFRGRGLASTLLNRSVPDWSGPLAAECGLLLCSDDLLGFYGRLGWHQVICPVRFTQPLGEHVWQANCMVLPLNDGTYEPQEIDLCGLPW